MKYNCFRPLSVELWRCLPHDGVTPFLNVKYAFPEGKVPPCFLALWLANLQLRLIRLVEWRKKSQYSRENTRYWETTWGNPIQTNEAWSNVLESWPPACSHVPDQGKYCLERHIRCLHYMFDITVGINRSIHVENPPLTIVFIAKLQLAKKLTEYMFISKVFTIFVWCLSKCVNVLITFVECQTPQ